MSEDKDLLRALEKLEKEGDDLKSGVELEKQNKFEYIQFGFCLMALTFVIVSALSSEEKVDFLQLCLIVILCAGLVSSYKGKY